MRKTLVWMLAAALLVVCFAGCGQKEEPIPAEETVSGRLIAFDGTELQLDGDASFTLSAGTKADLARGFVLGDSFTVTYQPESGEVLSLTSERAADEEFTVRGTVKSIDTLTVTIAGEDGESYSFPLSTAALDLWQGLEKGIYVEARGIGVPAENGNCLWLQSLRDNDGKSLLSAEATEEAEEEEPAPEAEVPEVQAEEPVMDGEELAWELTPAEDEVWTTEPANLRLGPGMEYTRTAMVPGGETFQRLGIAGDWSLVDVDGREGYVMTALLLTDIPEQSYVIHYEAEGGEGVPADQYKAQGIEIALSAAVPVREGYSFDGWNTDPDGYGIRLKAGDMFQMDEDTVLYAQWIEGAPKPTPAPTADPEAEAEEEEEAAEPTPTPEPGPILDSCRALAGVIAAVDGDELVLEASGESYTFDIATASVLAERGLHPGDGVTVWYAGEIGEDGDCSRAPAVSLEATAGKAELEGEVAGLWANGLALEVKGTLLFLEADGQGLSVGDKVTAILKAESAGGNLLAATDIQ